MPSDPFRLVPQDLRLTDPRELAEEARRLAGQVRNGFMRAQSAAYKRQWLERACLALEAMGEMVYARDGRDGVQFALAMRERDRRLAEARGEPEAPQEPVREPVSPTKR